MSRAPSASPTAPAAGDGRAVDPFGLVREELLLVEAELAAGGECDARAVGEIGEYLRASGGKRIRAALVLLCARVAGCEAGPRVRLAAIVETIHAATLIHDDIIDAAMTRRGRPSANARWGNQTCVLAGDWLYMQAFRRALAERHFGILEALIGLTQNMVEGELMQLEMLGRVVTADAHRELMMRKTARLFEVAAQLGALAARAPQAVVSGLGRFGRHLGLAFQMVDDILDFTAREGELGKPVGSDLREGKMTLPAIYAWEGTGAAGREALEQVLRDGGGDATRLAEIQALVGASGGLERARAEAGEQAGRALEALGALPDSPGRAALELLPALVVERSS